MKQSGVTMIEMILFLAIFAILTVFMINSVFAMISAYGHSKNISRITLDGTVALERIIREIRLADSIDTGVSVLGVDPSHLVLNTTVSGIDETPIAREFYISDDRVALEEDGIIDFLNSDKVTVTRFIATRIDSGRSEAVRVELDLEIQDGNETYSQSFFNSAILRGSY